MIEQHQIVNAEQVAMLRKAITPAPAMSEEKPILCETPQTTNQEERLKKLAKWEARLKSCTNTVEQLEELREVIMDRIFFEGTKKERLKLEHRYELLQYLLFGSDDYCVPGTVEKQLEELRSDVMELGADDHELSDEVKELLRRIDVVAEEFSDE
jgi:hypothetical protein